MVALGRRISELIHLSWKSPFLIVTHAGAKTDLYSRFLAKSRFLVNFIPRLSFPALRVRLLAGAVYLSGLVFVVLTPENSGEEWCCGASVVSVADAVFQSLRRLLSLLVDVLESHCAMSD